MLLNQEAAYRVAQAYVAVVDWPTLSDPIRQELVDLTGNKGRNVPQQVMNSFRAHKVTALVPAAQLTVACPPASAEAIRIWALDGLVPPSPEGRTTAEQLQFILDVLDLNFDFSFPPITPDSHTAQLVLDMADHGQ